MLFEQARIFAVILLLFSVAFVASAFFLLGSTEDAKTNAGVLCLVLGWVCLSILMGGAADWK